MTLRIHTRTHTRTHTPHAYTHTTPHTRTHTHTHTHMHARTHAYTRTHTHTTHTHTHTTHTHTHTRTHPYHVHQLLIPPSHAVKELCYFPESCYLGLHKAGYVLQVVLNKRLRDGVWREETARGTHQACDEGHKETVQWAAISAGGTD